MSFDRFSLNESLLRGVRDLGFAEPTPIQTQAIPPAREGRDLLACAMTGSGKTAAFLLPILDQLLERPRGKTRALVLAPTRELAAQIHAHLEALAVHLPITSAAVFGGVGMRPQEAALRRGVDVLIATPGRLLDHLQHPYASLDSIEFLVLDEADRMLDMGFLPDVRRILRRVPTKRQTLFFSATMPPPIVELSREMLTRPETINLERRSAPATGITQAIYPVPEDLKPALLEELLRRGDIGNAIVFCRTKHRANRLADFLDKAGVPTARIHGNRSQSARTDALEGFKSGRYRLLVATDIVARGIDVEALEHVVNFDVPVQAEDYVHRVGRTARAGAIGEAYTFASPEEERKELRAIERAVGRSIPRVRVEGFDYAARAAERFEVPIQERIAEIRKRKAEERERARQKAERKAQRETEEAARRERRGPAAGGSGGRGGSGRGSASSGGPSRSQQSDGRAEGRDGREPAFAGGDRRRRRGGRGRS